MSRPKGIPHTEEWKKMMSLKFKGRVGPNKGKKMPESMRIKTALRMKGNKYTLGKAPPNKGKKMSKDQIIKMSSCRLGYKHSSETKRKISILGKGRKRSAETRNRISLAKMGSLNPQWKNGASFIPYSTDWTKTLRRSIRERDRYTCRICSSVQGDKGLDVHHIDYNKKNCDPVNLITLCHSCHMKTNSNRENWIIYFQICLGTS